MKVLYLIGGGLALLLGVIGAFLPVLPTTPFLILAAFFFSKSSPRLHAWLLNHRLAGPVIRDWEENRIIRPRAKILASIMILAATIFTVTRTQIPWWGRLSAAIITLGAWLFVVTRRSK